MDLLKHTSRINNETNLLVCASGRGSNFQAVFNAIQSGEIKSSRIGALIIDRHSSLAEDFARKNQIEVRVLDFNSYRSPSDFSEDLLSTLESFKPNLILALGFMRVFSQKIVRKFHNQIINIHPSLLPKFKGLNAQRQAIEANERISGATIHIVDEGVDTGPILAQREVKIKAGDDVKSLSERILKEEHIMIVEVLADFCKKNQQEKRNSLRSSPLAVAK